jgi:hypothetical protein
MSYKLYSDKTNKFSCNVQVKGASLKKSKARVIIESSEFSYIFNGSIDQKGKCEIIIPKTSNFLNENSQGKMKLEIIADDVYFEPWSSDFIVKKDKNVQVSISEQKEPETEVKVIVQEQQDTEIFYSKEELSKILKENYGLSEC